MYQPAAINVGFFRSDTNSISQSCLTTIIVFLARALLIRWRMPYRYLTVKGMVGAVASHGINASDARCTDTSNVLYRSRRLDTMTVQVVADKITRIRVIHDALTDAGAAPHPTIASTATPPLPSLPVAPPSPMSAAAANADAGNDVFRSFSWFDLEFPEQVPFAPLVDVEACHRLWAHPATGYVVAISCLAIAIWSQVTTTVAELIMVVMLMTLFSALLLAQIDRTILQLLFSVSFQYLYLLGVTLAWLASSLLESELNVVQRIRSANARGVSQEFVLHAIHVNQGLWVLATLIVLSMDALQLPRASKLCMLMAYFGFGVYVLYSYAVWDQGGSPSVCLLHACDGTRNIELLMQVYSLFSAWSPFSSNSV